VKKAIRTATNERAETDAREFREGRKNPRVKMNVGNDVSWNKERTT
jgi:hypothetical protein